MNSREGSSFRARILVFAAACMMGAGGCGPRRAEHSNQRLFDLRTIESLGRQIYEQDRYAAAATEILFRDAGTPESLTREGLAGWVFTRSKQGRIVVRFVRESDGRPEPAYDIAFSSFRDGTCDRKPQGRLSRNELAQYRAKRLVGINLPRREWPMYNLVALPDVEGDGFLVYALAATRDPNLVVVGGHYRFTVSGDGEKILLAEKLFRSFLVLDKRQVPEGSGNCLFATHLGWDTPAETHVFLTLLHAQPLHVATKNGDLWRIEKGNMRRVGHVEIASDGVRVRTNVVATVSDRKPPYEDQAR